MNTYMIGYDLHKPSQDYPKLEKAIKKFGWWWHHLDSTWIIKSDMSASEVYDFLSHFMDGNDALLVAALTGEAAWFGFNKPGSDWLKDYL